MSMAYRSSLRMLNDQEGIVGCGLKRDTSCFGLGLSPRCLESTIESLTIPLMGELAYNRGFKVAVFNYAPVMRKGLDWAGAPFGF